MWCASKYCADGVGCGDLSKCAVDTIPENFNRVSCMVPPCYYETLEVRGSQMFSGKNFYDVSGGKS